jgi:hypothetical protein
VGLPFGSEQSVEPIALEHLRSDKMSRTECAH